MGTNGNGRHQITGKVTILISGDRKLEAETTGLIGQFAIHPRFRYGEARGPGWTVTHVPTGKSVWHVANHEDAQRVAEWLVKESAIPEDLKTLTEPRIEEIKAALRDIAEPAL